MPMGPPQQPIFFFFKVIWYSVDGVPVVFMRMCAIAAGLLALSPELAWQVGYIVVSRGLVRNTLGQLSRCNVESDVLGRSLEIVSL